MQLLTLKTVLVGMDLDDSSLVAVRAGQTLAEAAGAKLHVVHVSNSDATDAVVAALERIGVRPGDAPVHVVSGDPARAISDLGHEIDADVIIVGPHREQKRPKGGRQLGSTALAVVTNATAPCLVLGQPLRLPLARVVVPVDLSDTARGALVIGLSWASALREPGRVSKNGTKLVVLHVHEPTKAVDPSALDAQLEHIERDAGAWAGVDIERATVESASPADGIAEYAKSHDADMLILGTRGDGLDDVARLGSVSEEVTQRLELPTLLVPPAVWATYVGSASHQTGRAE